MSIDAWAEDLLPTKWSRRIGVLTVALVAAAYGSFSLIPASYLPTSPEHLFAVRLLVASAVLIVGSVTVLVLVVRAHGAQAKRIAELEKALAARPALAAAEAPKRDIQSLSPIHYDDRGIV